MLRWMLTLPFNLWQSSAHLSPAWFLVHTSHSGLGTIDIQGVPINVLLEQSLQAQITPATTGEAAEPLEAVEAWGESWLT